MHILLRRNLKCTSYLVSHHKKIGILSQPAKTLYCKFVPNLTVSVKNKKNLGLGIFKQMWTMWLCVLSGRQFENTQCRTLGADETSLKVHFCILLAGYACDADHDDNYYEDFYFDDFDDFDDYHLSSRL